MQVITKLNQIVINTISSLAALLARGTMSFRKIIAVHCAVRDQIASVSAWLPVTSNRASHFETSYH